MAHCLFPHILVSTPLSPKTFAGHWAGRWHFSPCTTLSVLLLLTHSLSLPPWVSFYIELSSFSLISSKWHWHTKGLGLKVGFFSAQHRIRNNLNWILVFSVLQTHLVFAAGVVLRWPGWLPSPQAPLPPDSPHSLSTLHILGVFTSTSQFPTGRSKRTLSCRTIHLFGFSHPGYDGGRGIIFQNQTWPLRYFFPNKWPLTLLEIFFAFSYFQPQATF